MLTLTLPEHHARELAQAIGQRIEWLRAEALYHGYSILEQAESLRDCRDLLEALEACRDASPLLTLPPVTEAAESAPEGGPGMWPPRATAGRVAAPVKSDCTPEPEPPGGAP